MATAHERTARDLNMTFRRLGAHGDVLSDGDGVLIPLSTAKNVVAAVGYVQGGSFAPFVNTLLGRAHTDVHLRGDEGMHLRRALDEIIRESDRRKKIDRGQIPGALSGAEVSRLARRHPHLFRL